MVIAAGMLARNEDWVIALTARAVMRWVDHLVVLIHSSTDATDDIATAIACEYPGRVHILWEHEPLWEEMRHRQRLLTMARALGATHYATVDADEILTANLIPTIRDKVEQIRPTQVLELPWVCLSGGIDRYYTTGRWYGNRISLAFRDAPHLHWTSATRGGFDHHQRPPMGQPYIGWSDVLQATDPAKHMGGLMHLQFVNERRLKAKQYWYQLEEKSRDGRVRSDYRGTVRDAIAGQSAPCPVSWWAGYEDLIQYYHPEGEPWQLAEARRLIAANPGIEHGLDDFGLGLAAS